MPTRGSRGRGGKRSAGRTRGQISALQQGMRELKGYAVKRVSSDPPPYNEFQTIVLRTRHRMIAGTYDLLKMAPAGVQFKVRKVTSWAPLDAETTSLEYKENLQVLTANIPGVVRTQDYADKNRRAACALVPPQDDFIQIIATGPTSPTSYINVGTNTAEVCIVDIVWELKVALSIDAPTPIPL